MDPRLSNLPPQRIGGISPRAVKRALNFIDKNIGEDLRIAEIAQAVGVGPSYFSHAFTRAAGISPHRYIIHRRITLAMERLRADERTEIVQLAYELGFSSQAHFAEVFKRVVGVTPSAFKRRIGGTETGMVADRCQRPAFVRCPFESICDAEPMP